MGNLTRPKLFRRLREGVARSLPAAAVAVAMAAAAGGGGCGGSGVPSSGEESSLDYRAIAAAALGPTWQLLRRAGDISRFVARDVAALVASGAAASADTVFRIPGRDGYYTVQWYDADDDKALSSGDGLDIEFEDCAPPGRDRAWSGVIRLPDLSLGPSSVSSPNFYADLKNDQSGAGGWTRMVGSLSIAWSASAAGERVTVYQGASGLSIAAGEGGVFLRRFSLTANCPPAGGTFEARAEGELFDRRYGPLTLVAVRPFTGTSIGSEPGIPAAGEAIVTRALGGSVTIRCTGAGAVALDADDNGDGVVDRRLTASWADLVKPFE